MVDMFCSDEVKEWEDKSLFWHYNYWKIISNKLSL